MEGPRVAFPIEQGQAVGLALTKFFIFARFFDGMVLTRAEFNQETIGEALNPFRMRAIRAGIDLSGVIPGLRAGGIRQPCQRQQVAGIGCIGEIACP